MQSRTLAVSPNFFEYRFHVSSWNWRHPRLHFPFESMIWMSSRPELSWNANFSIQRSRPDASVTITELSCEVVAVIAFRLAVEAAHTAVLTTRILMLICIEGRTHGDAGSGRTEGG